MKHVPIWIQQPHLDELNLLSVNTLAGHMGIQFTEIGPNFLIATLPVNSHTLQPMGILHGGASCVLAETIGSIGGNYCVDPSHCTCVGIDININHIRAVSKGTVKGIGTPLHLGRTTQVWEIKLYDLEERLTAVSRLTLAVIKKNPSH